MEGWAARALTPPSSFSRLQIGTTRVVNEDETEGRYSRHGRGEKVGGVLSKNKQQNSYNFHFTMLSSSKIRVWHNNEVAAYEHEVI